MRVRTNGVAVGTLAVHAIQLALSTDVLLPNIRDAVVGTLKGFDGLVNIVLDDCVEYLRDPSDANKLQDPPVTRPLGLIVCRGTSVTVMMPEDGLTAIENPFLSEEGAE